MDFEMDEEDGHKRHHVEALNRWFRRIDEKDRKSRWNACLKTSF
jgi:hypothetical protein